MNGWLLGLALVTYNNAANRWKPFHGPWYIPLNLAVSASLAALSLLVWNLDLDDIGLGPDQGPGLAIGLTAGAVCALPLFAALGSRRSRAQVADGRLARMGRRELAYRAILRVPVGTALTEELAFRGVLFALAAANGNLQASLWSSLAFGLWHIVPAYNRLEENRRVVGRAPISVAGSIAGSVALTFVAGVLFCWLRIRTGGIAAPFAMHATLNSLGTVAAHLANRRMGGPDYP